MSDSIEPIKEQLTLFEKIKRYFKRKTHKHKPQTVTIDSQKNMLQYMKAANDFGSSCEETSKALAEAGKRISDVMNSSIVTLYADEEPYCIINQKGDVVWGIKK